MRIVDGPLFICYSRKQLYFVETLVLTLERMGIATWFDLQKLEPGTDFHA